MHTSQQSLLSRISIILSSLCVLHCLSVPIIILLLPAMAGLFSNTIEMVFILAIVPVSAFGFFPTWVRHKNHSRLAGYFISLAAILFGFFYFHDGHHSTNFFQIGLMASGAFGLAYNIYKNNKHTHVCSNPHHHHH